VLLLVGGARTAAAATRAAAALWAGRGSSKREVKDGRKAATHLRVAAVVVVVVVVAAAAAVAVAAAVVVVAWSASSRTGSSGICSIRRRVGRIHQAHTRASEGGRAPSVVVVVVVVVVGLGIGDFGVGCEAYNVCTVLLRCVGVSSRSRIESPNLWCRSPSSYEPIDRKRKGSLRSITHP
jgi:hypothetical protein